MDCKLEVVVVPVSDVDRAKAYYTEKLGFHLDVDHRAGEDFRVVQLTPPGSACSVTLMRNPERAGSLSGLHLIVADIEAARSELVERDTAVSEIFHFVDGQQTPGPDPMRTDYGSFLSFEDPDGNGWMLQEVTGRGTPGAADRGAVDPTGADLKRLLGEDPGGPVVMLNLLKFADGGRDSYARYGEAIRPFLAEVGAELVYAGDCSTTLVAPDGHDWDAVLLARYPTRAAFSRMVANPEYTKITGLRTAALTSAVLQATVSWS